MNSCLVTAQFVRVERYWHFMIAEQGGEERFGCLNIAVFLDKNIQHSAITSALRP